jgi:MFS family permease
MPPPRRPIDAGPLPDSSHKLFGRGRAAAGVGAVALVSLLAFETMAVAAAMPAIAAALGGLAQYALAFGGMLSTSVLGMVQAGRWCDRHGPIRATVAGLLLFGAGLLLAGGANAMSAVVAGRVVQGLGAGMLGVSLYVGMGQLVPQSLHPRLFALFAAAWVVPGLVGPVLAAWLVALFGWRAVFLAVAATIPVVAALLLPAFARLPAPMPSGGDSGSRPASVAWAALASLGALLFNTASGQASPALRLPFLALGLAAAAVAAGRLLPRGTLRASAGLPAVIALRGLIASAFACGEAFVPLYLTREAGWSLAQAGLALSAAAVMWSGGSAVQARIDTPRNRRRALQAGFALVAAGIALVAAQMLTGISAWTVVAGWAVAGFGIGLSFPMLSVLTLGLSAADARGRNASALQLSDALGSSAALALAGVLFNQAGAGAGSLGHLLVLTLALALALVAALLGGRAFE